MATSATPTTVAGEARSWIAAAWDPDLPLVEWRRRLLESGWACPTWPVEWHGRGLPAWADHVVSTELAAAGAVGAPPGSGMALAAPTILTHGSDALKRLLLARIVTGEDTWCQLFSEPGSGSDLAGLTTSAYLDGDEWVVNGQKLWSTSAHHADHGMLLARTDWDVPKHAGITWFALPMRQPGVEARPLRQMNGHASFNEVFLTDARVPVDHVVGRPGDGWTVARTTLAHERGFASMRRARYDIGRGRALREAEAEAAAHFETYRWYPQRAGRVDLVVEHAVATGRNGDPLARQAVADVLARQRAPLWTPLRAGDNRARGRVPGREGSLGKLGLSEVARTAARVHSQLGGPSGMLTGPEAPFDGMIAEVLTSVPAQSIAGGTDEVQHDIIGERALGLPREPQLDRDLPFREVQRSTSPRTSPRTGGDPGRPGAP
ncbi:MAG: acyl-CoA dehydrogenase family protein [Acidimicrobiales bacterium]